MTSVKVRVPATTANLGPGFDALGMALGLYNEVELGLAEETTVEISGEGEGALARDSRHLVLSSAQQLAAEAGQSVAGWKLSQINRIPLARGMGSSSAAIVGGLVAANKLLATGLSREALLDLAARIEGHPDNVAPAIYGGLTVCCANEELCCLPLPAPCLRVILAVPDFEVSTEAARKVMPREISHSDGVFNATHVAMVVASLASGRYDLLGCGMHDKLHQPYRAHLVPGFEQVIEAALEAGAYAACLSGSGPTMAAFADEHEEAIAAAMCQAFLEAGVQCKTLVVPVDAAGAVIV
ncbi:MAG: homoserine kinase [Armatimonadota bacterium]